MLTLASRAPTPRPSLAGWAVLAVVIVICSYVVTLLLAAFCVYLPFQLFRKADFGIHGMALLLCGLVMASIILRSLLPHGNKFLPPGPCIDPTQQPRLVSELEGIAHALNEPLPSEIYLVPDVNAWVMERDATMGIGGRRVMGLGLPLIGILTISQFRAVVAHEFGHYYGGDTRLGPFVYKARAAMAHTLTQLGSESGFLGELLRFPVARLAHSLVMGSLEAYWKLFMRATQMISRKQEYRADELACYVAGGDALVEGLRLIHGASAAAAAFWETEMLPALRAGYRPPIAQGFASFVAAPKIARAISKDLETELGQVKENVYNSHPPLRDRIAATRAYPSASGGTGDAPAITLLDEVDRLEVQLLNTSSRFKGVALKPVSWNEVGSLVDVPMWRSFVGAMAPLLQGFRMDSLPDAVGRLSEIGSRIRDPQGMLLTREQRRARASRLLEISVALALLEQGWDLSTEPGQFHLQHGEQELNPPEIVAGLISGTLSPDAWMNRCKEAEIGNLPLDHFSWLAAPAEERF